MVIKTATGLEVISRKDFIHEFKQSYGGGHLTMIGPTGRGKSQLSGQLQHAVIHPRRRFVYLHGKIKGRDLVIEQLANTNHYRIVDSWPPGMHWHPDKWKRNINGWVVRPLNKPGENQTAENNLLASEFAKAINYGYQNTNKKLQVITIVDERAQAEEDLKLRNNLDGPLQRGLPDNPEWNHIQRGRWVSYHCFDAPSDIFIFQDDDEANRKRYSEFCIGDPQLIRHVAANLQTREIKRRGGKSIISQALYMRRGDRFMCIVDT